MKLSPHPLAPALALLFAMSGCSSILCDADSIDVDGDCIKIEDYCDEGEIYVDGACVKECDSGETRACGTDEGECVSGIQTCADNGWGACDGEVPPSDELCDGLDNDCDGTADNSTFEEVCDGVDNDCDNLVDEGVMSVKEYPATDGVSAVAALGDVFLVARVGDHNDRIRSYDLNGDDTALFEPLEDTNSSFASMYQYGEAVYIVYQSSGSKLELARVELSGAAQPQIAHRKTSQDSVWILGAFGFTGGRRTRIGQTGNDLYVIGGGSSTLVMRSFNSQTLAGFDSTEDAIEGVGTTAHFDVAANGTLGWIEDSMVHMGGLFANGLLVLDTEVAAGTALGLADGNDLLTKGLALVNTSDFLELYELNPSRDCIPGGLCNESLGKADAPVDLAYRNGAWFVVAGKKIFAVGPDGTVLFSHQTGLSDPDDVQVAVNGTTTAIVQSTILDFGLGGLSPDESVVTFVGCLGD